MDTLAEQLRGTRPWQNPAGAEPGGGLWPR